jgi:hypothetical protein
MVEAILENAERFRHMRDLIVKEILPIVGR